MSKTMEGCESIPDTDLFDSLPDEILILIICHLSDRDLVGTSLLAHRWKDLWTLVPHLELDVSLELNPDVFVYNALRHQSGKLNSVCIVNDSFSYYSNAEPWIPYLSSQGIVKLSLKTSTTFYEFDPRNILTIPSLQELCLNNFNLLDHEATFPVINLRALRLEYVLINDGKLDRLIANAHFLEQLCLSQCGHLKNPSIKSRVLKRLEMEDCGNISSLTIHTPALASLSLYPLMKLTAFKVRAPSLVSLKTSSYEILNFVYRNSVVKHSKTPKNIGVFRNLRKLVIDISLTKEATKISTILRKCTKLEEFTIINEPEPTKLDTIGTYWRDKDFVPNCLSNHLKYLLINGFQGHSLEMDFVKYVLANSCFLKKLAIINIRNCSGGMLQVLKLMPKASSDLIFVTRAERQWGYGPYGGEDGYNQRTKCSQ